MIPNYYLKLLLLEPAVIFPLVDSIRYGQRHMRNSFLKRIFSNDC